MLAKEAASTHDDHTLPAEVEGNFDVAKQAQNLLSLMNDEQYQFVAAPYLQSSIGQHMRHILDVYRALMAWPDNDFIDYDARRRAHPVETDFTIAQAEWQVINEWLASVTPTSINMALRVNGEVSLTHHAPSVTASTLGRELAFVASHAVHHFALIRVSLSAQDIETDTSFGLAPATATFCREGN
ncbi:DinB family protein [Enterovibrio norvegicus]|uniref:DinB family protein n=1 Tax=Enterovibrio norvegicus TaxID=188144 RepID=A0ABV4L865_9GAMM|nr:DinB family protein [Enterovibrio norvegicus]OEF56382.1 hypothetical protein A1OU_16590 [Enterovibrio norvegicus]